jgi:hypothetical protein
MKDLHGKLVSSPGPKNSSGIWEVTTSLASRESKGSRRNWKPLLKCLSELVQTLFVVLLTTYLLLILLETIFEGSVSSHINLNHLLIIVIVVGIVAVLTGPKTVEKRRKERLTLRNIFMIACVGIGGAAIVWYKTKEIGWLSYVVSFVSGTLIVLLSVLSWQEDEKDEGQELGTQPATETEQAVVKAIADAKNAFKRAKSEAAEAKRKAIREAKEAMDRAIREAKDKYGPKNRQDN